MRPRITRGRLVIGSAVVALGSVAFGTFDASPATGIVSSLTIEPGFHGVVTAASPCQAGRTVRVKRFKRRAPDKLIGSDTTDANGIWDVPSNKTRGIYYAKAKPLIVSASGYAYGYASTFCEAARSKRLRLGRGRRR